MVAFFSLLKKTFDCLRNSTTGYLVSLEFRLEGGKDFVSLSSIQELC